MARFAAYLDREDRRIRLGGRIDRPIANPGDDGSEATNWQIAAARDFYGRE
jgi:hypothetical protein